MSRVNMDILFDLAIVLKCKFEMMINLLNAGIMYRLNSSKSVNYYSYSPPVVLRNWQGSTLGDSLLSCFHHLLLKEQCVYFFFA